MKAGAMKKMKQNTSRTLALAVVGFAMLVAAVPDWARGGLLLFGAIYAVMVFAMDASIRASFRPWLDSCLRRNDATKAPAKPPVARRAAT